jgi:ZIP family zinc transporter
MSSYDKENVLPALLLVLGAGASTGIGAAVVFFPFLVKLANRRVLAASLGFSAGVMTYVSFVEIFGKSNESFVNAGHEEGRAYVYATLCFFGGAVIMLMLNAMVDFLHGRKHSHADDVPKKTKKATRESVDKQLKKGVSDGPPCCSSDPVQQLNDVQRMGSVLEHEIEDAANEATVAPAAIEATEIEDQKMPSEEVDEVDAEVVESSEDDDEAEKLHKMGLNTAIAIGLHNFPEGLATFVAALQDPKVGAVLAVAIAIHNIPEGLCVALPIYYASGNRVKGFLWALLSGASEFVAALLGWAVLANSFSESAYAILFGIVAGMMIMISVKELLPTAHVYDKEDTVVSYSFIIGMVVMALSLCLFQA